MTPHQVCKDSMLRYPSISPSAKAVMYHVLTVIGNGYEWNSDGKIILREYAGKNLPEGKIDMHTYMDEMIKYDPTYADSVKNVAIKMRRKFIEENIDTIIEAYDDVFSEDICYDLHSYMKPEIVSYDYALIFNYPENVSKDWVNAMIKFINHWQVSLNMEYGSNSQDKEYWQDWPEKARKLKIKLNETSENLHIKAGYGTAAERDALTKRLIDEVLRKNH